MNTETPLGDVTISRSEYEALLADKGRLDYLDECNRRLNTACGTAYAWSLVQSPNVNRLMMNFPRGVDLHDSAPVGCHPTGCLSVRAAIDSGSGFKTGTPPEADVLINDHLNEWAKEWILDGDLVRCRQCNRAIIYSRRNEALVHAAGCKNLKGYPWELLVALSPQ